MCYVFDVVCFAKFGVLDIFCCIDAVLAVSCYLLVLLCCLIVALLALFGLGVGGLVLVVCVGRSLISLRRCCLLFGGIGFGVWWFVVICLWFSVLVNSVVLAFLYLIVG